MGTAERGLSSAIVPIIDKRAILASIINASDENEMDRAKNGNSSVALLEVLDIFDTGTRRIQRGLQELSGI
jgi:uncharacterized membrane protein YdbT with pleckstrin-like domain